MMVERKTSWEIREWVEEAITEKQHEKDLSWSEIHYDKFGKEFEEIHKRDNKVWLSEERVKKEYVSKEELEDVLTKKYQTIFTGNKGRLDINRQKISAIWELVENKEVNKE